MNLNFLKRIGGMDARIEVTKREIHTYTVLIDGREYQIKESEYRKIRQSLNILDGYLKNNLPFGLKSLSLVREGGQSRFVFDVKGQNFLVDYDPDEFATCSDCGFQEFVLKEVLIPKLYPVPIVLGGDRCVVCQFEHATIPVASDLLGTSDDKPTPALESGGEEVEVERDGADKAIEVKEVFKKEEVKPTTEQDSNESSLADFAHSLQQKVSEPEVSKPVEEPSRDELQKTDDVFSKVGGELLKKYRELISSQRTYTLKRGKITERWSTVVLNGQGHGDKIIALTVQLLEESEVDDMDWEMVSLQPTRIKGFMLSKKRDYLMVKSKGAGEKHRMYIGARDYGNHLDVTWFLVERTPFWKTLAKFIAIVYTLGGAITLLHFDIFDEQDLRAYVTVTHRSLQGAVKALMEELGQDTTVLELKSQGVLMVW